jgi:hypothetical protein
MCAWRSRRGRVRKARQKKPCVCRRFASDIFFVLLSFVIAGHSRLQTASFHSPVPAIHAEVSLVKRFPPALYMRRFSMDHRHRRPKDAVLRTAMPGGDEF